MIYTRGPASKTRRLCFPNHMRHISEAFLDHSFSFYTGTSWEQDLWLGQFTYGWLGLDYLIIAGLFLHEQAMQQF